MLLNIEAQPQWIEWRSAPLQQRASLARNIAKQFHPDKWDQFNPTCDVDHKGAVGMRASAALLSRVNFQRCSRRKLGARNFQARNRGDFKGPRGDEKARRSRDGGLRQGNWRRGHLQEDQRSLSAADRSRPAVVQTLRHGVSSLGTQ